MDFTDKTKRSVGCVAAIVILVALIIIGIFVSSWLASGIFCILLLSIMSYLSAPKIGRLGQGIFTCLICSAMFFYVYSSENEDFVIGMVIGVLLGWFFGYGYLFHYRK